MKGSNSSFPLTKLASKYSELQNNGVFLSNRNSIEIVRQRIGQLLERIDLNDAPDRLKKLYKLWNKFKEQEAGHNPERIVTKRQIDNEFEKAYHDYAAWEQMFNALKLDSELVGAEVKIAKDLHAMMSAEDAYEMIAEIFAIILRIEDDPKKIMRYQYEFTQLVGDRSIIET